MSVLIKNATIADPSSVHNGKQLDVFIQNNRIVSIGKKLKDKARKTIEGKNLFVSPGWVDVMADYCDPGFEHKETITTGLNAAAAGGFTEVFVVPNTHPVAANKSVVEYIQKQAHGHTTQLHVLGATTRNLEGKDLAEMMDMRQAGAIAFTDGWKPIQNAGLMVKALEYVKAFDGIIIQLPVLASMAAGGLMNEGETSVRMGMSGIPNIAESLLVQRDIELVRYTGSRIHFSGITTPESLALIKAAKKEGLQVTCSVTPYHLLYTELDLQQYNSNFKVEPPLRTEAERKLLIKALSDGTIDCIATHHRPQDWDAKVSEFEYAQYGMVSQETCWAMLQKAAPKVEVERWAELLSTNARQIFGLEKVSLVEGAPAKLTIFDKETTWIYTSATKKTKGINAPLLGETLTGKIY